MKQWTTDNPGLTFLIIVIGILALIQMVEAFAR